MNKKQSIKLISESWSYLAEALRDCGNGYATSYLEAHLAEERGHRRFCPDGISCGLTVPQSAKLFAVKQIADFLCGDNAPRAEDYLHLRKTVYFSYALVHEYRKQIESALSRFSMEELRSLDYAELNKSE